MHFQKSSKNNKLNLGCFTDRRPDYVNIDIDPNVRPDITADVRKLHMLPDNSCSEILASHILEHFYESEVVPVLREWNRLLVPGGKLVLIVPDVEKVMIKWHKNELSDDIILKGFIGDDQEQNPWMLHKTFFWWSRLSSILAANNYDRIKEVNKRDELVWLQVVCYRRIG